MSGRLTSSTSARAPHPLGRMDLLRAELLRKKAQREAAPTLMKRPAPLEETAREVDLVRDGTALAQPATVVESLELTVDDVIAGLRTAGLPVRLFGESDEARTLRFSLHAAPSARTRVTAPLATKRRRVEDDDAGGASEARGAVPADGDAATRAHVVAPPALGAVPPLPVHVHTADTRADASRRESYPHTAAAEHRAASRSDPRAGDKYVYKCFRGALYEWEERVGGASEGEAASLQGRNSARMLRETEENLRPFLKLLKAGQLPGDIKTACIDIVDRVLDRDFKKAGDAYILLAVGNAQWLIGVSQVGLHERAAREKVYLGKIAHVMNDETQRKYIIAVKRLLSWLQDQATDIDPSRMYQPG